MSCIDIYHTSSRKNLKINQSKNKSKLVEISLKPNVRLKWS